MNTLSKRIMAIAALPFLATCDSNPVDGPITAKGPSVAYSLWSPGPNDTCTKADHDRYATVGPDSLQYPTWHPAVDPVSGCSFGHEHGRDPHGSALYRAVGDMSSGTPTSSSTFTIRGCAGTRTTSATKWNGRTTSSCTSTTAATRC